jgi:hypothetical protein
MTLTASIRPLGSELDAFLFALVGEDRNGMPLSVISVLARLDLDPWVEATKLANMPAETATRTMAAWLDGLSDPALTPASPDTRATHLIALLPRRANSNSPVPVAGTGAVATTHSRTLVKPILFALYLILSLGIPLVIARREPPVRPEPVHGPVSVTAPSQAPPAISSK